MVQAAGKWAARAQATTLTCRQEGPGGGRGRRAWGGDGRAPGSRGRTPRDSRLVRSESRAPRAQPQVRAAGQAGPRGPAGEVLWPGKVQLCAAIPGMSGGPEGLEPRARRFPGPGRWKGARRAGAHPPGAAAGRARSAGAGARPGPLLDGGIPWPRQSAHKGGCGRGARGSRRGADGSGDSAARGGPGRGRPGRAVAALRLLKSKQSSVLRAASGRPAPLPVSPRTYSVVYSLEKATFSSS